MSEPDLHAVTGAFSYTGKYIARRLLAEGARVRTLTGHPQRAHEFGATIDVRRLQFDDVEGLTESLRGASVLYNTYWIRFERGESTFARAVANTKRLIAAAEAAGVRRIVHVSIANAERAPELPYYRGKAELEREIRASGLSSAILRPTVLFGEEDILINNIAWVLRHLPVFGVPGDGSYRMRPIFVDDVAKLAVELAKRDDNVTVDAVGPEVFRFDEWVRLLARTVRSRALIVHMPPWLALLATRAIGLAVDDVVLTADEVRGLRAGLLTTDAPSAGHTRLSEWLEQHRDRVGRRYASEVERHYR